MSLESMFERIAIALEKLSTSFEAIEETERAISHIRDDLIRSAIMGGQKTVEKQEVSEVAEISDDELRMAVQAYAKKHSRDDAIDLIKSHGSEGRLSNIPQNQRAKFIEECKK